MGHQGALLLLLLDVGNANVRTGRVDQCMISLSGFLGIQAEVLFCKCVLERQEFVVATDSDVRRQQEGTSTRSGLSFRYKHTAESGFLAFSVD